MGGVSRGRSPASASRSAGSCSSPASSGGAAGSSAMRRTTIIFYGIGGGAALLVAAFGINHSGDLRRRRRCCSRSSRSRGLFVLAGRDAGGDRAARRRHRGVPRRPRRDHGPVLRVPRHGPDHGRDRRRDRGASWRGLDGIFGVALVMLGIALLPLGQLRRHEHVRLVRAVPASVRRGHERAPRPARLARGARGAVVAPHHLATSAGLGGPRRRRARGRRGDRDQRRPGRRDAQRLRDRRRRVLAGVGRGRGRAGRDQRLRAGAGGGRCRGAPRARADADPAARAARDHGPGRGPVVGATRTAAGAGCRATRSSPPRSSTRRPASRRGTGSIARSIEGTDASLGDAAWARGLPERLASRGRPWRPGELVRLPALAATLRTLADEGFDAYYDGDLGERIARGLAAAGAPFTVEDLRAHTPSGRRRSRRPTAAPG